MPEIAASLAVSESILYRWRETYGKGKAGSANRSEADREDVEKMRGGLRELEQENAFLKQPP